MGVIQRVRMFATLAILVAVAAVGYQTLRNDAQVTLYVLFSPASANPQVSVQLTDTLPIIYPVTFPDWTRNTRLAPGTRVILSVMLAGSGKAECQLFQDGMEVRHKWMDGPGNISCQWVVAG